MKRCFVIFAAVLSVIGYSGPAFAQYDALPRAYIKMDRGFFTPAHVVIDGKEIPQYKTDKIIDAMAKNPVAQQYMKNSRVDQNWALGTLWAGLGAAVIYAVSTASNDHDHRYDAGVYWTLFMAGLIPSAVFSHYAAANFFKAINLYNGIDEKRASNWHLSIGPIADGATGGLTWSF